MSAKQVRDTTPAHLKLGYQHNAERQRIREHLIRRGHNPGDLAFEFRITRIQERIHRYKPTFRQRQEAARARGEAWVASDKPPLPSPSLTLEEWQYLAEHFEGANHPLAQSIQAKAAMR
jgi:hypothetical protein